MPATASPPTLRPALRKARARPSGLTAGECRTFHHRTTFRPVCNMSPADPGGARPAVVAQPALVGGQSALPVREQRAHRGHQHDEPAPATGHPSTLSALMDVVALLASNPGGRGARRAYEASGTVAKFAAVAEYGIREWLKPICPKGLAGSNPARRTYSRPRAAALRGGRRRLPLSRPSSQGGPPSPDAYMSARSSRMNGFVLRSRPIVVDGPWPGCTTVASSRGRILSAIDSMSCGNEPPGRSVRPIEPAKR